MVKKCFAMGELAQWSRGQGQGHRWAAQELTEEVQGQALSGKFLRDRKEIPW